MRDLDTFSKDKRRHIVLILRQFDRGDITEHEALNALVFTDVAHRIEADQAKALIRSVKQIGIGNRKLLPEDEVTDDTKA